MRAKEVLFQHWIFFLILIVASILRLHSISTNMIFIGDQGRDVLVAKDMVEKGNVPLLGIPSSIPRFKQGPLFIYFLALIYWISTGSTLGLGLLAASFGIAAIIALYLLVYTYDTKRDATLSAALFALLPMMILHSRMPYHIVPIPLFVIIYLWQLMRWSRDEKWSAFLVGLAFSLVLQFELAAFPLILMIPISKFIARTRLFGYSRPSDDSVSKNAMSIAKVTAGICIGLIPQILFDLTHGFAQLGGFILWVVYKLVTALLPFTHNSLADSGSPAKIKELVVLFLSVFTQNGIQIDQIFWLLLILAAGGVSFVYWSRLQMFSKVVIFSFLCLGAGFVFHRVPSEAYMPLLVPSTLVILVTALSQLPARARYLVGFLMVISLSLSVQKLEHESFFLLGTGESSWSEKRFGPSVGTQHAIVDSLFKVTGNRCIVLESLERDATFPTLYNNLEYLIAIDPRAIGSSCARIRIDRPVEAKRRWIDQGNVIDLGAYWIRLLDDQKVYAKAY